MLDAVAPELGGMDRFKNDASFRSHTIIGAAHVAAVTLYEDSAADANLPPYGPELKGATAKLQSKLAVVLQSRRCAALEEKLGNIDKARWRSFRQLGAKDVLNAIPSCDDLRLAKEEIRFSILEQLGVLPRDFDTLACGRCNAPLDKEHMVGARCWGQDISRHNAVIRVIREMASQAGHHVTLADMDLLRRESGKHGEIPDLCISGMGKDGGALVVDVKVVCAYAQGYVNQGAANVDLRAAQAGAAEKRAKYEEALRLKGFEFVPAVFESSGAIEKVTLDKVIKPLVEDAEARPFNAYYAVNWAARTRLTYWKQRLAVAIRRSVGRKYHMLRSHARARF